MWCRAGDGRADRDTEGNQPNNRRTASGTVSAISKNLLSLQRSSTTEMNGEKGSQNNSAVLSVGMRYDRYQLTDPVGGDEVRPGQVEHDPRAALADQRMQILAEQFPGGIVNRPGRGGQHVPLFVGNLQFHFAISSIDHPDSRLPGPGIPLQQPRRSLNNGVHPVSTQK